MNALISLRRSVELLSTGEPCQLHVYRCILVNVLVGFFATPLHELMARDASDLEAFPDLAGFISSVASCAIIYLGIRAAWRANSFVDGQRFAERFVVLITPLTIWFGIGLAAYVVGWVVLLDMPTQDWLLPVAPVLATGLMFFILYRSFLALRQTRGDRDKV